MRIQKLFGIVLLSFVNQLFIMSAVIAKSSDTTQTRDPEKSYLQINAIIRDSKGPDKADEKEVVSGAIIKVLNSNNYLVASYFADKKGKISFRLPFDKKFRVIIQKKDYVAKIVEIDTNVPVDDNNAYIFGVDVALFAIVPNLNTDVLLKPVARIQYDKMGKEFNYDVSYTHKINGELKKMYKEYYSLLKNQ